MSGGLEHDLHPAGPTPTRGVAHNQNQQNEQGGKEVEWDAEITEQVPDARIAWRSTRGAQNAGLVTFHRLSDQSCRVTLQLDYNPEGLVENLGDWLGVVSRRTENDLERFKGFIETRGIETGAWRGEVRSPDKRSGL